MKLKYENIIALMLFILFSHNIVIHVINNGIYAMQIIEVMFYIGMIITFRYVVKDIRVNKERE